MAQFREKAAHLCEVLDAEATRGEAAEILGTLIESVTIYPHGEHGPEAEVVAKVSDLMAWATNDNAASKGDLATMLVLASRNEKSPKRWCA